MPTPKADVASAERAAATAISTGVTTAGAIVDEVNAADALLPPIPGRRMDPEPKSLNATLEKVNDRNHVAGIGFRAFQRFSVAKATLLAAGTTYYVFLSLFSIIALGYGVAAMFNSKRMSDAITEAIAEAFPGLQDSGGITPEALTTAGQAASIVGLVLMMYSASAAMYATSRSLHNIYGAPKDPRNYVWARIRLLGWLLLIAPILLLSYVMSSAVTGVVKDLLTEWGITGVGSQTLIGVLGISIALILDFIIVYLMLGHLGGIMPDPAARITGAVVGAICIEVLKLAMAWVISFSLSQPKYGAFAAPIAILLVIYIQCIAVFGCAALAAAMGERSTLRAEAAEQKEISEHREVPEPEETQTKEAEPADAVLGESDEEVQ